MAEKKYELIKESKITESREIGTDLSHLTKYNEYDKDRGEYVSYYKPEDIRKERKKLKEKRKALKKDECEYEDIFNTSNFVKPKLLEETYNLYRIRALKDFGDVKAGDLGGYIESERNLSQEGDCWVYDKAKVTDEAKIYGNAKIKGYVVISDNAEVFDNAKVYDYAEVSGNAKVYGNAQVEDSAKIYNKVEVFDNALIDKETTLYNKAKVYGKAKVTENAELHDEVQVYDNAKIDNARLYDKAQVYGKAKVFGDATVSENAKVYDKAQICNARVTDNAQVYGEAQVYGKGVEIRDNAKVYDKAKIEATRGTLYNYKCKIEGNAQVYGNAKVYEQAQVYGESEVYDNAIIYNKAQVGDNAKVFGKAQVYGNAKVFEYTEISDDTKIIDNTIIENSKEIKVENVKKDFILENDFNLENEIQKYEEHCSKIVDKLKLQDELPNFQVISQKGVLYEKNSENNNITEIKNFVENLKGEEFWDNMSLKDIRNWKELRNDEVVSIVYESKDDRDNITLEEFTDYNDYAKDTVINALSKEYAKNPDTIESLRKDILDKVPNKEVVKEKVEVVKDIEKEHLEKEEKVTNKTFGYRSDF